jgi:ADP-ribosylglycohydrolase
MLLPLDVIAARVRQEIDARTLQGFAVDGLRAIWERVGSDRDGLLALHDSLKTLPMREGWQYNEPSSLEQIRQERTEAVELPLFYLAETEIRNKIHGAWLGRAVGCVLGKPMEVGFTMEQIRSYLEGANAYPLTDYFPAQSTNERPLRRDCVPSMRGYVNYAQEDDDLNYMCLAVKLLETKGVGFSTLDVGMNWLESIPFFWTWGPEHAVYLNLALAIGEHSANNIDLEAVSGHLNPGVEWIGAQIRADVYGYIAPGHPEMAAEFAWRDSYLTHRKSGIYGAMWVSAMNAAAFTLLNPEAIIRAGLAQVPQRSRFAEAIEQTISWYHTDQDWWKTGLRIRECYDQYGFAGTINNACVVAAALLYGWGDGKDAPSVIFERAITTAVQMAYDTDCNAATVGSIIGILLGASLLPGKWTTALHDTMRTCVVGFGQVSIADMAQRSYELSRIVRNWIELK